MGLRMGSTRPMPMKAMTQAKATDQTVLGWRHIRAPTSGAEGEAEGEARGEGWAGPGRRRDPRAGRAAGRDGSCGAAGSGVVAASTTARSTSTASRSRARSASPSWSRTGRRVWARERRAAASTSAPAGVMVISVARASCGSGSRRAQPFSSRRLTCPVIVGWLVWSAWARSPMRAGPSSLIWASSRTWAGGASRRACRVAQRFSRATRPSSSSPRGCGAVMYP